MSSINPADPSLLTDIDVEYRHFHCCGDEDLVFLRCPRCSHVWVECYECSTWYVDLSDLSKRSSSFVSNVEERVRCPACERPFDDFYYLMSPYVDAYLPTAQQVIDAGFGAFLASHIREGSEGR